MGDIPNTLTDNKLITITTEDGKVILGTIEITYVYREVIVLPNKNQDNIVITESHLKPETKQAPLGHIVKDLSNIGRKSENMPATGIGLLSVVLGFVVRKIVKNLNIIRKIRKEVALNTYFIINS